MQTKLTKEHREAAYAAINADPEYSKQSIVSTLIELIGEAVLSVQPSIPHPHSEAVEAFFRATHRLDLGNGRSINLSPSGAVCGERLVTRFKVHPAQFESLTAAEAVGQAFCRAGLHAHAKDSLLCQSIADEVVENVVVKPDLPEPVRALTASQSVALNGLMKNAAHDAGDVEDACPRIEEDEDAYWAWNTYHGLRKLLNHPGAVSLPMDLIELLNLATPGPWEIVGSTHSYGIGGDFKPGRFELVAGGTAGKDARAITAAVNWLREQIATATDRIDERRAGSDFGAMTPPYRNPVPEQAPPSAAFSAESYHEAIHCLKSLWAIVPALLQALGAEAEGVEIKASRKDSGEVVASVTLAHLMKRADKAISAAEAMTTEAKPEEVSDGR